MPHPLSFYCDCEQTQALMRRFGDRLQKLSRNNLLDLITVVSAEAECSDQDCIFSQDEFISTVNALNTSVTEAVGFAFEDLEGFPARNANALIFGLAGMLYLKCEANNTQTQPNQLAGQTLDTLFSMRF